LESWRRIGLKIPPGGHTIDEIAAVHSHISSYNYSL
jgi:hypothetical protein